MGLLHHAKYLEYFEMGRTELLRLSGLTYRDLEARGFLLVVAQVECKYRAPVRYDDVVSLRTRLVKLTRARIDHEYEMGVEGRPVCQARTTVACVDRAGRLQPVPEEIYRLGPAGRQAER
jgi:acyl-CoA thioester hydrolase